MDNLININDNGRPKLSTVEFSINLSTYCNWNCSYCSENTDKNNRNKLNFKIFKLLIKKVFLEFHKSGITFCSLSLLGGELSIDDDYLNYFEFLLQESQQYEFILEFDLITNFTGSVNFFNSFCDFKLKFPKHKYIISVTLHEEYYLKKEDIVKIIHKIDRIVTNGIMVDLRVLISDSPLNKKLQQFILEIFGNDEKNIKFPKIKISTDKLINYDFNNFEYGYKLKSQKYRYCDALYYSFKNNKIHDSCRNKDYTFLNFKIVKKLIHCNKMCPCSHLNTTFNKYIKGTENE